MLSCQGLSGDFFTVQSKIISLLKQPWEALHQVLSWYLEIISTEGLQFLSSQGKMHWAFL